jgi:hypothetical protein
MKIFDIIILLSIFILPGINAQTCRLTGKIIDNDSKQSMPGVYVKIINIVDSGIVNMVSTDQDGIFNFTELKSGHKYLLNASFLGYTDLNMNIITAPGLKNIGTISLLPKSQAIGEVVIKGDPPASTQKGDTTEMNSGAFKVNKDASAEDLILKMPGVTVQNGTYVAHGEQVTKVLVDGKPFFGDDPSITLKNLPAEVIDKVQIFNKLSEQSELTGFDDGNSQKTINIVTKTNRRNGVFGKIFAGSDFKDNMGDRYVIGDNANYFKDQQRISYLGLTNNINQQNFAAQDLISATGGSGRNYIVQTLPGITTTSSLGLNYTNTWGKKVNITASYFFNYSNNNYLEDQNINNFSQNLIQNEPTHADVKNYNNRFNMRLEWDPDTMNIFIMTPKISFQNNVSGSSSFTLSASDTGSFINSITNNNYILSDGNSISDELVYRHKFNIPRRTISVSITPTFTDRNSSTNQFIYSRYTVKQDSSSRNNLTTSEFPTRGITVNLAYTEPAGKNGMVQISYNFGYTYSNANTRFDTVANGNKIFLDSLSSVYNSSYLTNRPGLSYRYKLNKLNFSIGTDIQKAQLDGTLVYPDSGKLSRSYFNILPNMLLLYRSGTQSNLRIYYRTSTSPPSVTQLQDILNVSNGPNLSMGNKSLKQQYSHNMMARYMVSDPDKNLTFSGFFGLTYTLDPVENLTISGLPKKDTIVPGYNLLLKPGGSLSVPENLNNTWTIRSMLNFGFPLKFISSKINLLTGLNYSLIPGEIESLVTGPNNPHPGIVLNKNHTSSFTNGIVLASNINENVDFTLSYTNTLNTTLNSSQPNSSYIYQTISGKINLIFLNGFLFETDALAQINSGLSQGYNQKYIVWNGSFGKKFLKKQNAEIKVSVYDLLKDGKNITWSTSPYSTQDIQYNTLPRYFMLTFTYTLRNFKGAAPEFKNRRDFYPGGGHFGGGGFGPPDR